MSKILDKSFKYTNSSKTDIRKTFARIRKELATQNNKIKEPLVAENMATFKTLADFEEVLGIR
jgi:hypothetical protein